MTPLINNESRDPAAGAQLRLSARWLLRVTFATAMAFVLPASALPAAVADEQPARITLRVGNFKLKPGGAGIGNRINARIVRNFRQRHPGIDIKPATGIVMRGMSQEIAPMMQIAGNIPPDLLFVDLRKSESYISQGLLEPLDDLIGDALLADLKRRLHPRLWDVIHRRGPDGEKHIYCLPVEHVLNALLYRRDWLRDAGLPDRAPQTWEEMMQWSRQVVDPERGRAGLIVFSTDLQGLGQAFSTWLRGIGGDFLRPVGPPEADDWEAAFNSPEAVEAAYLFLRMFKEKWTRDDGTEMRGHVLRYDQPK